MFSKAKITAELIYRYVRETLSREAPGLAGKVSPYRGGLLPEERREKEKIKELPLYPEERANRRPAAEQVLKLFSLVQRHILHNNDYEVQIFEPEFTELQKEVLRLLGVPDPSYCGGR